MTRLDSPDYIDEANVQSAVKMLAPITYHVRSPGTAGPGSNPYLVHRIKHPKSLAIPTPSTTVYPVLNLNIGQTKLLLCACEVFVFCFYFASPRGAERSEIFFRKRPGWSFTPTNHSAPGGVYSHYYGSCGHERGALLRCDTTRII